MSTRCESSSSVKRKVSINLRQPIIPPLNTSNQSDNGLSKNHKLSKNIMIATYEANGELQEFFELIKRPNKTKFRNFRHHGVKSI